MIDHVDRESFWRCGVCDREIRQQITGRDSEPHVCSGQTVEGEASTHQPTIMRYVERERVYPSRAARKLLSTFDKSDWGLVEQAVAHYAQNRRRTARKNPGVENVMRSVWEPFDAIQRACKWLQREAPGEFKIGGSNVTFAADRDSAARSALLDALDVLKEMKRDIAGHRATWDHFGRLIDKGIAEGAAAEQALWGCAKAPTVTPTRGET